jgi:hypothetical protein
MNSVDTLAHTCLYVKYVVLYMLFVIKTPHKFRGERYCGVRCCTQELLVADRAEAGASASAVRRASVVVAVASATKHTVRTADAVAVAVAGLAAAAAASTASATADAARNAVHDGTTAATATAAAGTLRALHAVSIVSMAGVATGAVVLRSSARHREGQCRHHEDSLQHAASLSATDSAVAR